MEIDPSRTGCATNNEESVNGLIERLLQGMSLREKIGQTVQVTVCKMMATGMPFDEFFERYPVGSVFLGGEIIDSGTQVNVERLMQAQKASKIPLLVAGDLESGVGWAVKGRTQFPSPLALGSADCEEIAYEYGKFTAFEARELGFNWTFSPVVDITLNWLNPIVANRGISDDPERTIRLARKLIRGLQENGLAACAKHFPGDGVDFRDQHLVTTVNSLSEEDWWQNHGKVFQELINAGVFSIMAGHIALPWCDNGMADGGRPSPATASRNILSGLLRDRMGFDGVLVSDALTMAGFTAWGERETRLKAAFNAGNDVMLWPGYSYFELIETCLAKGCVSPERLDKSVRRVLHLKYKLGLLEDPDYPRQALFNMTRKQQIEITEFSAKLGQCSITLIRNRNKLLPLNTNATRSLLLLLAVPNHLKEQDLAHLKLLEDLIRARGIDVTVIKNGNCLDLTKRQEAGEHWDAFLVVYSLMTHQMKNTIRPTGEMAEVMWMQQHTVNLEPITISLNSPYLLHDMPNLDVLINAYSTSSDTIRALDQALFGEIDFNYNSPVIV